jgi:hypothetical protein
MHATDLVGINGITRALLVYTCQQGVYPRGHVHPLRLPDGCNDKLIYHVRSYIFSPESDSRLLTAWGRVFLEKLSVASKSNCSHLWDPKVHYHVYKNPQSVPVQSQALVIC